MSDVLYDEDENINSDNIIYEDEESDDSSDENSNSELDESHSLLNNLKTKKKNMYFDEELVSGLLLEYQSYLEYGINEKGKRVCLSREKAPKDIEKEIMANLLLIANAIINKYKFWRFENIEDLRMEAMKAMFAYLPNFVPGKGTTFNLFSIICKDDLRNYTLKNYKHRITEDIDCHFDISSPKELNYNLLFDTIESKFLEIIDHHYLRDKRKKYIELTSILMEYLDKNKKVVGKNDLASAFKEYGYKTTEYKKFIEEMSKYKDDIYQLIAVKR